MVLSVEFLFPCFDKPHNLRLSNQKLHYQQRNAQQVYVLPMDEMFGCGNVQRQ